MKQKRSAAFVSIASACILMMGLAGGCTTTTTTDSGSTDAQTLNRAYMSQVNQIMEDLGEELEDFVDAVSRQDVVSMQTQAQDAFEVLDDLEALSAPVDLTEVHEDYLAGAEALEEALDAYIALYTEIDSATDDNPFDWSTYDARLAEIQELYDEGIGLLESADETAAAME